MHKYSTTYPQPVDNFQNNYSILTTTGNCIRLIYTIGMSRICPNCYFIGRGKNGPLNASFVVGVVFVAIGIYGLTNKDFLFGSYFMWVGTNSILIALGILRIVQHFVGGNLCPSCSYKPMIKVNTLEAIKLIKEHDFEKDIQTPDPASKKT